MKESAYEYVLFESRCFPQDAAVAISALLQFAASFKILQYRSFPRLSRSEFVTMKATV
jgi:hypothetical protein